MPPTCVASDGETARQPCRNNYPFSLDPEPILSYTCFYTLRCVKREDQMPTNLAIDDRLLEEAQKVGGHKTKRETVNAALDEYIAHRKQLGILSLFGTIDYDPDYDYKRERKAKRL